jgi:hypothetical protein
MKQPVTVTEPFQSAKLATWWKSSKGIYKLARMTNSNDPQVGFRYLRSLHKNCRVPIVFQVSPSIKWTQIDPPEGETGYGRTDTPTEQIKTKRRTKHKSK